MKISIIVPCYNEISTIFEIINKINKIQIEKEIIIVIIEIIEEDDREIMVLVFLQTQH